MTSYNVLPFRETSNVLGAVFDGTVFLGEKLVWLSYLVDYSNYMRQIMSAELIYGRLMGAVLYGLIERDK